MASCYFLEAEELKDAADDQTEDPEQDVRFTFF